MDWKGLKELTPKAVQSRVDRLLSGVRERIAREVAEETAGAMLMGKPLDELYFENLESLDGVEEAILHIIYCAQLQPGNEGATAKAARTTIENLRLGIEDTVKCAALRVKAKQGTQLWVCTRERIANLICVEALCCPTSGGGVENEGEATDRESRQVNYAGATLGPAAYRRLGMVALKEGDALREIGPAHPPQSADEYVFLADNMEPALAMAQYQKALALDPNHVMAHFFLAESFEAVGNPEAAKAEFLRVTHLVPNDPDAHWHLAEILYDTGEPEAAAAEYAYALSVAPGDEGILERYSLLDPWMKDRLPEQLTGIHQEAQGGPISTTSSPPVAPKKPLCLADLKKTPEGTFDLSGLSANELADLLWEEATEGKEE